MPANPPDPLTALLEQLSVATASQSGNRDAADSLKAAVGGSTDTASGRDDQPEQDSLPATEPEAGAEQMKRRKKKKKQKKKPTCLEAQADVSQSL